MGSEWQPSKLGDVIAVNPSRPLAKGSDSVYISMQQVETENRSVNEINHRAFKGSGARFQNGDTLLARITPCLENGKTAYVDFLDDEEVGHGSTEFIVLSGIEGVSDDLFVYYLARYPEFRNFAIVRMEGSSGRQRVPAPTLKKYTFACPSYDEQRSISHILGSLDDKIELNRRMNQTLEAMARAIFKSWFVDFLPVRAKMAAKANDPMLLLPQAEPGMWFVYAIECEDGSLYIGQTEDLRQRWLQHVSGKGGRWTKTHPPQRVAYWEKQPSREEAVEREKWLKTGYGRKWLKKEIAASARTQTGDPVRAKAEGRPTGLPDDIAALFPESFEDSELGEVPMGWNPSNIGSEFYLTMGQSPLGKTYNETGNGLPFFQGRRDFGFRYPSNRVYCTAPQRLADHGDTLVSVRAPVGDINMAMERCCVGRGVAAVRHKSGSRSYTYYAMHTLSNRFARFEAEGTVFGAINKKQFEGLRWLSPAENLVGEFEKIAFALDEQIEKNTNETATLNALRDTLLPKLISGELRVPDAEKFVEEAGL